MKIVHMKVRNFKCNVCDRKFGTSVQMKSHKLAIHEKQKPFNCLDCEYRTAKYGNLNLHRSNVHGKHRMPKSEYDGLIAQLMEDITRPPMQTDPKGGVQT